MDSELRPNTLLIVAGACLRAERLDRPLANRIREAADDLLRRRIDGEPDVIVLSDVWYLNSQELHRIPTIAVGGPGVNNLSAYWQRELPRVLLIDSVLQIQMDVNGRDHRCCLWGMNHDDTVEAVDTFLSKGYLERFLNVFPSSLG
jgi:hypothetical protein